MLKHAILDQKLQKFDDDSSSSIQRKIIISKIQNPKTVIYNLGKFYISSQNMEKKCSTIGVHIITEIINLLLNYFADPRTT